jgi:hypothetical protein
MKMRTTAKSSRLQFSSYITLSAKGGLRENFELGLTVFAQFSGNKKGAKSQAYVLKALVTR